MLLICLIFLYVTNISQFENNFPSHTSLLFFSNDWNIFLKKYQVWHEKVHWLSSHLSPNLTRVTGNSGGFRWLVWVKSIPHKKTAIIENSHLPIQAFEQHIHQLVTGVKTSASGIYADLFKHFTAWWCLEVSSGEVQMMYWGIIWSHHIDTNDKNVA